MTFKLTKDELLELANNVIKNQNRLSEKALITKFYEKLLDILNNKQNSELVENSTEEDDNDDDVNYEDDDSLIKHILKNNEKKNKK